MTTESYAQAGGAQSSNYEETVVVPLEVTVNMPVAVFGYDRSVREVGHDTLASMSMETDSCMKSW